jgi:predicted MPP superfamily phosphohydrolase
MERIAIRDASVMRDERTRTGIEARLLRALARPPFDDALGRKGAFERFSRAQPHRVHHLPITVPGWPQWQRPLRIVYLSDLHLGSHAGDVARLEAIIAEAAQYRPDLALHGGDFVNMQPFGGGRVPPHITAAILARLTAPCGRVAVLGNHDYTYGPRDVADALRHNGITVLDDNLCSVEHEAHAVHIIGLPDARATRARGLKLIRSLAARPTLVLAHDPAWFAHMPPGPYLMLAGHTHGGQVRLPGIGVVTNASKAPLRWSHGLVNEGGRQLYVTAGLGTSGVPLRVGVPPEYAVLDINGG